MIFLLGICIGSFAKCLADRYPHYLIHARSRCCSCGHVLSAIDLFPILSFVLLKGRCRYCNAEIPISNIITEIVFGFLYPVLFIIPISFELRITTAILMPIFYLASAADIKHGEIPDLCSAVIVCTAILFSSYYVSTASIAAMLCIFCVRFGWLGAGDAKLIIAFTLFRGNGILAAMWSASLVCILFSVLIKNEKRRIPFAPFLCMGFMLCLLLS